MPEPGMCQHSCDRAPWPSSPCCFPSTAREGDSLSLLSSSTNGASNSVAWPDPCPQERNGAQLQLSPAVQGNKGQFGVQMWAPAPCPHPNHPEFLIQHLSWECGAGLAQQGTDRDVPQPLLICSPSNTSLSALHVRGNVHPQGQKQLPGGPPAPGQSAQTAGTAGQGCSRRLESSTAGSTTNVTWQCPDTGLAFSSVTWHCQRCHVPT